MKVREDLSKYESSYEKYKKNRRDVKRSRMRSILAWLISLPIIVPLGFWAYAEIEGMPLSDIRTWLGMCMVILIMGYAVLWIPCVVCYSLRRPGCK